MCILKGYKYNAIKSNITPVTAEKHWRGIKLEVKLEFITNTFLFRQKIRRHPAPYFTVCMTDLGMGYHCGITIESVREMAKSIGKTEAQL